MAARTRKIVCACGAVEYEAVGDPIISPVCYCTSCQSAGERIGARENAPVVLDPDAGTALSVFHRDRVRCLRGRDLVEEFRLTEKSPTKRLIARCCNSALMLAFDRGPYWVSVFSRRLSDAPPPEMRVQTRHAPDPELIPNDIPRYPGWPPRFFVRLLGGWIAYRLGR